MNIYVASKVSHAPQWREVRDMVSDSDITITSRWIDYEEHSDIVMNRKDELWQQCLEDIAAADAMIIYMRSGIRPSEAALVKSGYAIALGKPVVCINTRPQTFTDLDSKMDAEFTHHPLWMWVHCPTAYMAGFYEGFQKALKALNVLG